MCVRNGVVYFERVFFFFLVAFEEPTVNSAQVVNTCKKDGGRWVE